MCASGFHFFVASFMHQLHALLQDTTQSYASLLKDKLNEWYYKLTQNTDSTFKGGAQAQLFESAPEPKKHAKKAVEEVCTCFILFIICYISDFRFDIYAQASQAVSDTGKLAKQQTESIWHRAFSGAEVPCVQFLLSNCNIHPSHACVSYVLPLFIARCGQSCRCITSCQGNIERLWSSSMTSSYA